MTTVYSAPADEVAMMESAGFTWDPTCTGRTRWTHLETGITALRQPYMRQSDWTAHLAEKIREAERTSRSCHASA